MKRYRWQLGVFTSIDSGLGLPLSMVAELGVPTVHLHVPTQKFRQTQAPERTRRLLEEAKIEVTAVFCGFAGESYADIKTVARTVGLVPAATRSERLVEAVEIAAFSQAIGSDTLGLHLGHIPDSSDPGYEELVQVTRKLCDDCKAFQQYVHLETGQESAEDLLSFLEDTERENLYLNFDPANLILYGSGDPVDALRNVAHRVRSVHCKDAVWSKHPGETWGQEVPLGEGDVNFRAMLKLLHTSGYTGPLTIERETSPNPDIQREQIVHACRFLRQCMDSIR